MILFNIVMKNKKSKNRNQYFFLCDLIRFKKRFVGTISRIIEKSFVKKAPLSLLLLWPVLKLATGSVSFFLRTLIKILNHNLVQSITTQK